MRDLSLWNVRLFPIGDVQVRLHAFFVAFAALLIHGLPSIIVALWLIALLFVSVLVHEIGHCWGAVRFGGQPTQIVLWPFGGLGPIHGAPDPKSELFTAISGPLASLGMAIAASIALVLLQGGAPPIDPLRPPAIGDVWGHLDVVRWLCWLNAVLALVNLLPASPLDGARILRSWIWLKHGYRTAVAWVATISKALALVMWLGAFYLHSTDNTDLKFGVLPFMLLGVLLFFSAKQEAERSLDLDSEDRESQFEYSGVLVGGRKNAPVKRKRGPNLLQRWLLERREARRRRQRQVEEDDDRRLDEVLARMHEFGRDALSEEDRALLARVSARYKSRLRG